MNNNPTDARTLPEPLTDEELNVHFTAIGKHIQATSKGHIESTRRIHDLYQSMLTDKEVEEVQAEMERRMAELREREQND